MREWWKKWVCPGTGKVSARVNSRLTARLGWYRWVRGRFARLTVPFRLALLAAAAFATSVAMARLAGMLERMHVPGAPGASVNTLASPFTDSTEAKAIVDGWISWDAWADPASRPELVEYRRIADTWIALDIVLFAPLVAAILFLGLRALARGYEGQERRAANIGASLALGYLLADQLENAFTFAFIELEGQQSWLATGVRAASWGKWILIGLAVAFGVAAYARSRRVPTPPEIPRLGATLRALWPQTTVAALLVGILVFLPASVRDQLSDVIRGWRDSAGHAAVAFSLTAGLAAFIWFTSGSVIARAEVDTAPRFWALRAWEQLVFALLVLGAGLMWDANVLLLVIGGIWVTISFLSMFLRGANDRPRIEPDYDAPRFLTLVPPAALYIAWLRAEIGLGTWTPYRSWVVVGGAAVLVIVALVLGAQRRPPTRPAAAKTATAVVGVAAVGAIALASTHSTLVGATAAVGRTLGSMGVLLLATIVVLALLLVADHVFGGPPTGVLGFLRLRRAPVLGFAVLVVVLTAVFTTAPGFHRARGDLDGSWTALSTEGVVQAWNGATSGDLAYRPMFLIASSGGGIRAAYWTLLVLDCIFGDPDNETASRLCADPPGEWTDDVLLASGVSGGSVGLAAFSAQRWGNDYAQPADLDGGVLDEVLAHTLAVDVPNAFAHLPDLPDRAEALEIAFEKQIDALSGGFLETQSDRFPVLMLNGSAVEDGCRFNGSLMAVAATGSDGRESCRDLARFEIPASVGGETEDVPDPPSTSSTRDLTAFVCSGDDLPISTVAVLSARFPVVSPSGALKHCTDDRWTFVVDGGYLDSSAADPLADLLPSVARQARARVPTEPDAPCVQPVVVQIDNGYAELTGPSTPGRPREGVAPLVGIGSAAGASADAARQRLAILADRLPRCLAAPRLLPTYVHIYPRSHPAFQAPLGWSLSAGSQSDLNRELHSDPNACAIGIVRAWLGDPTRTDCVSGVATVDGKPLVATTVEACVDAEQPTASSDQCAKATTDSNGVFTIAITYAGREDAATGWRQGWVRLAGGGEFQACGSIESGALASCTFEAMPNAVQAAAGSDLMAAAVGAAALMYGVLILMALCRFASTRAVAKRTLHRIATGDRSMRAGSIRTLLEANGYDVDDVHRWMRAYRAGAPAVWLVGPRRVPNTFLPRLPAPDGGGEADSQ